MAESYFGGASKGIRGGGAAKKVFIVVINDTTITLMPAILRNIKLIARFIKILITATILVM